MNYIRSKIVSHNTRCHSFCFGFSFFLLNTKTHHFVQWKRNLPFLMLFVPLKLSSILIFLLLLLLCGHFIYFTYFYAYFVDFYVVIFFFYRNRFGNRNIKHYFPLICLKILCFSFWFSVPLLWLNNIYWDKNQNCHWMFWIERII